MERNVKRKKWRRKLSQYAFFCDFIWWTWWCCQFLILFIFLATKVAIFDWHMKVTHHLQYNNQRKRNEIIQWKMIINISYAIMCGKCTFLKISLNSFHAYFIFFKFFFIIILRAHSTYKSALNNFFLSRFAVTHSLTLFHICWLKQRQQ